MALVYGTTTAMTLTLTSLADGSWRESTVVDNGTNLFVGAHIGGSVQVGTSPTANSSIDFYLYKDINAASTAYTGGASGSDAAYTADGEEFCFTKLGSIIVDATSDQDYVFDFELPWKILPRKWGIVVENNTGAALNATGTNNAIVYTGNKFS